MQKIAITAKKILSIVCPKFLISLEFYHTFGRKLDWKNPKDINEKINWLKLYSDTSLWTKCADKYEVREYVACSGYPDALVKLYGKWDKAEDIDWESLPNQFVMKVNNGSGDIYVCKDKSKVSKNDVIQQFKKVLNSNFANYNVEPHYTLMKPCIIAEELLDAKLQPIETKSLIDYKIWCFNGKPYYVWACYDRVGDSVSVATYDLEWKRHDEKSADVPHYHIATKDIPRPKSLDQMLKIAAKLSEGIPQVRVDLYEVDNKPYFGEMTFTSAGGFNDFYTQEFLDELGSYCDLSIAPRK